MISFVGAGPGAADLISVRGAKALERADLVIYAGSLVNPDLLQYCRPDCRILDSAAMTLEAVSAAMIEAERSGQNVVRLHTGDPSLYGAVREQMLILEREGLEFDCVPGISSYAAAAAVLQREYTLPGISQSLILSRRAGRTPVPERESLRTLAVHGTSMVLFLSTGQVASCCEDLLASGAYQPETAAALVYRATWPDQQVIRSNLRDLPAAVAAAGLDRHALILVGDFLNAGADDELGACFKLKEQSGPKLERSKLYDPGFSHACREAEETRA